MAWHSECVTWLYIATLHDKGEDYESIARRIKTETCKVLGETRQKWHPITVHNVCKIIGIYETVKRR